jgi:hypothetical protein
MIAILYIAIGIVAAIATLAWRSRDVRKFLAGAFFVSAGSQFYLYLANVSVPLLGTDLVFTPDISAWRSIPHFVFFFLCFYFGFLKEPKETGR